MHGIRCSLALAVCACVSAICMSVCHKHEPCKKGELTEMQFEMWAKGINDFFVCFCCVLVNNIQLLFFT